MTTVEDIEKKLALLHGKAYCKLVGNGTTAIYLSLLAQNLSNQKVALPNNVCMNVVLPIYFSNNSPVFIDIEKETLGLDTELLKEYSIDTLIAVHSYGNIYKIEETEQYCKENNIFFIEDVAIAQGMQYKEQPLGSFGDISILSFGAGKMLDIGHGGAILTDNQELYNRILIHLEDLEMFDPLNATTVGTIGREHTRLYNIDYGASLNKYHQEFKALCLKNKKHYLYKFDSAYLEPLEKAIENLETLLDTRQENARYLNHKFKAAKLNSIKILEPKNGSAYWRFNLFVEKYRDELFAYLLSKKYKVSSWQHSVDVLFEENRVNTPVSDWVGRNIINFWVNEDIDKSYLDNISNDIIEFLKGKEL
ncbi:MAG: DegT/DnrJ/EryC1/StrS family aminotransferase [Epsilonproteobacteria bacterium]|nr:DegT/DnrJ/EryC1/StrS family aminotransferase [Campylobacterota bacterium]